MTLPMFPSEPTWKRTRRSNACEEQRHHDCLAWNCACLCHVDFGPTNEEAA